MTDKIDIRPVSGKRDLDAFIDLGYRLNGSDPAWVPPLRSEVMELLTPGKNPFHEHAKVQYFLAERGGEAVGRISAHIDLLALEQPPEQGMGPGTGNWGLLDAESEAIAHALIARAEDWLREQGMTRVLAPLSLSVWEEPGVLVKGFDHSPTVLMGHHPEHLHRWIESAGYDRAKTLYTYRLDIAQPFPKLIQRIVKSGHANPAIRIRKVDKKHYDQEAALIIRILNDAWSKNWGFVPFTEAEIAYAGKKMRPLVREELIRIAEVDGEPAAFMMTLPDMNEVIGRIKGKLFPFGWIRMLRFIRKPAVTTMRVPLMGVVKKHRNTRLASQLAFMLIESIRKSSVEEYGATQGEIGWILEDNRGMIAIAEAIDSEVNREYAIYDKAL